MTNKIIVHQSFVPPNIQCDFGRSFYGMPCVNFPICNCTKHKEVDVTMRVRIVIHWLAVCPGVRMTTGKLIIRSLDILNSEWLISRTNILQVYELHFFSTRNHKNDKGENKNNQLSLESVFDFGASSYRKMKISAVFFSDLWGSVINRHTSGMSKSTNPNLTPS